VEQFQFFEYDPSLSFLQDAEIVNAPGVSDLMALPTNIGISHAEIERERINGMLTVQFAPSENTTISADLMYTSNTLAQDSLVPGMWFAREFSYIEFDGSDIVNMPLQIIEPYAEPGERGKDLFYANYDDNTKDESVTIGLNLQHRFSEAWSMSFDAATSSSESGGDGPNGYNSIRMNIAAAGAGWQGAYWGSGVPTATIGVAPLLEQMGYDPIDIDSLCARTGLSAQHVSEALLRLFVEHTPAALAMLASSLMSGLGLMSST